jgi:hypothetical protein
MNERIKELAKQCWEERTEGQLHFDNEKFAELIVRECAGQCLSDDCMRILNHFGVKE